MASITLGWRCPFTNTYTLNKIKVFFTIYIIQFTPVCLYYLEGRVAMQTFGPVIQKLAVGHVI